MTKKKELNLEQIRTRVWKSPIYFLGFGFGSGLSPVAPGTMGTIAAIPVVLLLQPLGLLWYTLVTVLFAVVAIMVSDKISVDIGIHDHTGVNIDEIVGFLITMWGIPQGVLWIALGFIFFRLFDIWKPWPIRVIDEKIHGGFGMVLDDILAAVYAWICLQLILVYLG